MFIVLSVRDDVIEDLQGNRKNPDILAQYNIFTGRTFMHSKKPFHAAALILYRAESTNGLTNSLAMRGLHT